MDDFVEVAIKTIRVGNVTAILSTDTRVHFLHIHAPRIYNDLQGDPVKIVGNASNVQGKFRMVKIQIKKLKFFPIMGLLNLPRDSKVETSLTTEQLVGTPLEGKEEVFIGSVNKWILFFDGMTLPQGYVRTFECAKLMENLGVGYRL